MSRISCSFCTNPNPPEAKFCNQCGSPLGLKPCPACEAVNEAAAERCHQCGAAFEAPPAEVPTNPIEQSATEKTTSTAAEEAPVQTIAEVPFHTAAEEVPVHTVAEEVPVHIPESFADRLERDAGPHAFERVEPRMAHPGDHDAPEGAPYVLRSTRMRRRGGAWRAPLALVLLVAIAGAGYYAYQRDVPGLDRLGKFAFAERHADEPASADSRSGEPRAAAPATDASASAVPSKAPGPAGASTGTTASATAGTDAQPAAEANPASAALVSPKGRPEGEHAPERVSAEGSPTSVQPGAPGQPQADAASTQPAASGTKPKARPVAAPPGNDDEAARQRTDAAGRSRRQADADAIATQRLIARDLGTATVPSASAPAVPLDRDAAETQRLIERDLGPFLHRNDRSSGMSTYPAIN